MASRKDALFLGIDHTAIVVSDTAASVSFYRDLSACVWPGRVKTTGPNRSA